MTGFEGIKKVLVIKLRHIGDVLLTVPAIRAVKESLPEASVSALVNSGTEEMLTGNPLLDEVLTFDRSIKSKSLRKRGSGELKFIKGLRKKGFDMSVDLTGGDRAAIVGCLIGAKFRLGYDPGGAGFIGKKFFYTHVAKRPPERTHTVLRDMGLPGAFGLKTSNMSVDIFTTPEEDAFVKELLAKNGIGPETPYVHVHPTSRWLFKCWNDESMAAIIDLFEDEGLRVVLTSAPDKRETDKIKSIKASAKTDPVDLSGLLRLKHLASLSRGAALFFGVDSAPMHIAAASGAPVVALFGPSGVFDWGPWDNPASRDHTPYAALSGVQSFGRHTAIQEDWDCIPCGEDGCNGTKKSDCLEAIGVDKVTDLIRTKLLLKEKSIDA